MILVGVCGPLEGLAVSVVVVDEAVDGATPVRIPRGERSATSGCPWRCTDVGAVGTARRPISYV